LQQPFANSRSDHERLASLETEMAAVRRDIGEIKRDIVALLAQFNQMSGGKKALLALCTILGSLVAAIGVMAGLLFGRGG